MKKTVFLFLLGLHSLSILGQDNHDFVWLFGYNSGSAAGWGGTVIDFNTIPPEIYEESRPMNFDVTNASICDEEGYLRFYSNGVSIENSENTTMENGEGLNPGEYTDDHLEDGQRINQGAIAIPMPQDSGLFYLFHTPMEYPSDSIDWHSPILYYSTVDMTFNGGLGKVVEKNVAVIEDFLGYGKLSAVRHANGRDWWVLTQKHQSSEFYRVLVTPDGVENLGTFSVGNAFFDDGVGQAVFSPDGTNYARISAVNFDEGNYLDIYEFDRCSGLLNNHQQLIFNDTAYATGVVFSPNSQYMYVSTSRYVYQFYIGANDIFGTMQQVAMMDDFMVGSQFVPFHLAQLAPDGKIYIAAQASVEYLHVIHSPDMPCPDCQIENHGVHLPTKNAFSLPNFPNYRLGPLDGSPCDTLGLDNVPVAKFRYQQDTADYLRIEFTDLSFYEPAEWHWDFGDNATSSYQHTSRKYTTDGVYEVCLTVSNGNGTDTHCQTIQLGTVATAEEMPEIGITVFPNPAREGVNVILRDGYLPKAGSITLYDAVGRPQLRQKVSGGWNALRLDGLPPGLYFYEVKDGERLLGSGKLVRVE